MNKAAKTFLTITVISFGLGLTEAGSEFLHGGLKPIGAVAFILFFISNLLGKEMALMDQEQTVPQEEPSRPDTRETTGKLVTHHA